MSTDEGLQIGVLGPLLVTRDGTTATLSRGRIRTLIALLAMSAGRPVGIDRLAALIWPEEQPERVRSSLQSMVARARVEVPDAIVTTPNGYLLDIDPDHVDLLRFRRLVREASAAEKVDVALELLDQALGLWRGDPLADLRSSAVDRDFVPGLIDERLSAVHSRANLNLATGHSDRVISELLGVVNEYPLREELWAQLIRALVGAARRAEAIDQYHKAREFLSRELGLDPSPDLQNLYLQLLKSTTRGIPADQGEDEATTATEPAHTDAGLRAPRLLPAGTAGFVGRAGELKLLSEMSDSIVADTETMGISVVCGMAGVGKTALAVHWARHAAAMFPDGQLYADLRGFDASGDPAAPTEALCVFLGALGVPVEQIPVGLDAQAGLYRTLMAERRILIVLDNARDSAQVSPLLPGAAGSMVVVTSRNPLTPLAVGYGAQLIGLDVLSEDEATELLSSRLGAARIAAGGEAAAELAALCGGLPLALAITAARAAAHPGLPLSAFAGELQGTQQVLDALDAGDPSRNLRAVFSWSYQSLSSHAASLLQLLSIHPGPDISGPAAASLAGTSPRQIGAALRELAALHLITEDRLGRYVLHDLIRAFAAELADAVIPPEQRQAAIGRMLDHYLHTARAGDAILSPAQHPVPIPLTPTYEGSSPEELRSREQATNWFRSEYRVLMAVTSLAVEFGFDVHAWQLPMNFFRHLDWHGFWDDWDTVQRIAHDAAERLNDKEAKAYTLRSGGMLSMRLGFYEDALRQFQSALTLYVELDELAGQARAQGELSMVFSIQNRYSDALTHSESALELSAKLDNPYLRATSLNKVGWHTAHLGDFERALMLCKQALVLQQELENPLSEAFVLDSLGYIHQKLHNYSQSVQCFKRATTLFSEFGNRFELAATLSNLGDACNAADDLDSARDAWIRAIAILEELHHPSAADIRTKLDKYPRRVTSSPLEL
jgi:DNA-binding SARP family transcriptional activator